MTISGAINNALSGMTANGRLTDVTSNNLANALTDGYGRQSVELSSSALGGQGNGVQVVGVTRATASDITTARRIADGQTATLDPQADALGRLGQSFGEASTGDGLFGRVEDLENSMRLFAEAPESQARQVDVVEAARDTTDYLNYLSDEAAAVRQNADADISSYVDTVNSNLEEIDKLNAQIVRLSSGGRDVATLVDQRERLIDEVSAMIPTKVHPQDNGAVHLTTSEGLYLLAENPAELSFSRSPIITAGMTYDPAGTGALSGLTLNGIDITPGGNNPLQLQEGAIAGSFAVRDEIGVEFNTQIDQYAADLISRFEDPAVDPTLGATDPGMFTDDGGQLDTTNIEGLAGRISLNPLPDPDAGGDPTLLRDGLMATTAGPTSSDTVARAMADALTNPQSAAAIPGVDGNLSSSEMVSGIAEAIGVVRTDAEDRLASQRTTREALASTEAEQLGVDTDVELQNLIVIEQAFNANVQVIQAASRMLDEILEIR